ncbi:hypothetical protein [Pelagibius marinus]|uniref:hypothetical protein n=1 Tax=Pelagibius marinus TaxID=2762760 RepID=UPI001872F109|nr:hypothetical protein [Pelagibius marinus]
MQKFEFYLGELAGVLNLCRITDLAYELKELSDLTPYGRKGWRSTLSYDSIRGGRCTRYAERAREVLADRDKILAHLTETYDCPGGDCGPESGDASATAVCRSEAEDHLSSFSISEDDVESIKMIGRNAGDAQVIVSGSPGHEAWVRLAFCEGWMVLHLTPRCSLRQAFTRGDCKVEGVGSY